MDFLDFYGLREEPFRLSPDPAYFFPSMIHNNGLLSLNYSTEHAEGFCLLTGEPGTGKTTLLNVFIRNWQEKAAIAMVLTPRLSPEEFLVAVLEDFGVHCPRTNKNDIIKTFREFLVSETGRGRAVIILVDEAQNLPDETLEELRLLSNLETDRGKLLHIVLIGQPELLRRLRSPALRQLDQRIVTRVHLSPLEIEELREYISFRLARAGRGHVRFTEPAIRTIYRYSRGIPRLINTITTRTLMSAYLEESGEIRPNHVKYAARSLQLETEKDASRLVARPAFVVALVVSVVLYSVLSLVGGWMTDRSGKGMDTIIRAASSAGRGGNRAAASAADSRVNKGILTAAVRTAAANVREFPGMGSRRIHVLYRGETVKIVGEPALFAGSLWYPAEVDGVGRGWIAASVLDFTRKQGLSAEELLKHKGSRTYSPDMTRPLSGGE